MYRRAFLGVVGAGLSGCVGQSGSGYGTERSHEMAMDPWTTVDGRDAAVLPEGTFATLSYGNSISVRFSLTYRVTSGGDIDVWVMGESNYKSEYKEGAETFTYYPKSSKKNTTVGSIEASLPGGRYIVAFDNTSFYGAESTGSVTVAYE
jgi:hypothetical protein